MNILRRKTVNKLWTGKGMKSGVLSGEWGVE